MTKKRNIKTRLNDLANKLISFKTVWAIIATWMLYLEKLEGFYWSAIILAILGLHFGGDQLHQKRVDFNKEIVESENQSDIII